jgi:aliphatic nitrilase
MSPSPTIRVAAAQVEPIWGDLEATVAKTLEIIRDAAGKGVKVLALPELWIPGVSHGSHVVEVWE